MKYLHKNNTDFSKIALGTGRFGTKVCEEKAFEQLDLFVKSKGNLIDTARNYYEWVQNGRGMSEKTIGKWLVSRNCRQDIKISTKGGVSNKGNDWTIDLSRNNILQELQESLSALQTDYIDIYSFHRDEPARDVEEIVETAQTVKEKSKATALGVCNWTLPRVIKANNYAEKHGLTPFTFFQSWWSLAEYKFEMWNDANTTHMDSDFLHYIKAHNYTGLAFTSQSKGFFQKAISCGVNNIDDLLKERIVTDANLKKLDFIKSYCEQNNTNPTAVVLGYITSNVVDGIAMISCSQLSQLQDIMNNADYVLSKEVIKQLDSIK